MSNLDEALPEQAQEALGTYVGPASREDVVAALHSHELGEVVLFLQHADGQLLLHTSGTLHYPDNYVGVYTVGGREDNPPHANDVLNPSAWFDLPADLKADQYTGGIRVHLPGGVDVVIVLWQSVWFETESGDLAPGMA
jgi:hypothetical protein